MGTYPPHDQHDRRDRIPASWERTCQTTLCRFLRRMPGFEGSSLSYRTSSSEMSPNEGSKESSLRAHRGGRSSTACRLRRQLLLLRGSLDHDPIRLIASSVAARTKGGSAAALRPCVDVVPANGSFCDVGKPGASCFDAFSSREASARQALQPWEYNESSLPTVVAAIPGAGFSPRRPPRVIGLRVVGISRLPVLARGVRMAFTCVVGVEELLARGRGHPARLARVVLGCRVHLIGC